MTVPAPQEETSVRELVNTAATEASNLITNQIELAKAEVRESAKTAGSAFGLLIVALVILGLGGIFLLVTIAYVLVQLGLPVWAGFGVVTAFLFVLGLILALVGKARVGKIKGAERTINQMEITKAAFTGGLSETGEATVSLPPSN